MMKCKKGRLYVIENRNRKMGANEVYIQAWMNTGKDWVPFMFTQHQLAKAQERAVKNPEDCKPKRKFLFW
jgi:hypothetical protein